MARKTHVVLVDDIDGGAADETVTFGLDGTNYEIDLSTDNASRLRNELSRWVGHARRTGGRSTTTRKRASRSGGGPSGRSDTAAIREWARADGRKVSDRGRISADIMAAYEAANG